MAELDTVAVFNPTKEEFVVRFNGEPYKVAAESEKHYPTFLAFHIAKHLSDKLLTVDLLKMKSGKEYKENSFNPRNAQLMIYDNPKRRISLFKILRSKDLVQGCIEAFPFKGFIGEMSEYDKFVEKNGSEEEEKNEE